MAAAWRRVRAAAAAAAAAAAPAAAAAGGWRAAGGVDAGEAGRWVVRSGGRRGVVLLGPPPRRGAAASGGGGGAEEPGGEPWFCDPSRLRQSGEPCRARDMRTEALPDGATLDDVSYPAWHCPDGDGHCTERYYRGDNAQCASGYCGLTAETEGVCADVDGPVDGFGVGHECWRTDDCSAAGGLFCYRRKISQMSGQLEAQGHCSRCPFVVGGDWEPTEHCVECEDGGIKGCLANHHDKDSACITNRGVDVDDPDAERLLSKQLCCADDGGSCSNKELISRGCRQHSDGVIDCGRHVPPSQRKADSDMLTSLGDELESMVTGYFKCLTGKGRSRVARSLEGDDLGFLSACAADAICNTECTDGEEKSCYFRLGGTRVASDLTPPESNLAWILGIESCAAVPSNCMSFNPDGQLSQTFTQAYGPVQLSVKAIPHGHLELEGDTSDDGTGYMQLCMKDAGLDVSAELNVKWTEMPTDLSTSAWKAKYLLSDPQTFHRQLFMIGKFPLIVLASVQIVAYVDYAGEYDSTLDATLKISRNFGIEKLCVIKNATGMHSVFEWADPNAEFLVNLKNAYFHTKHHLKIRFGAEFTFYFNWIPFTVFPSIGMDLNAELTVTAEEETCANLKWDAFLGGYLGMTFGPRLLSGAELLAELSPSRVLGHACTAATDALRAAFPVPAGLDCAIEVGAGKCAELTRRELQVFDGGETHGLSFLELLRSVGPPPNPPQIGITKKGEWQVCTSHCGDNALECTGAGPAGRYAECSQAPAQLPRSWHRDPARSGRFARRFTLGKCGTAGGGADGDQPACPALLPDGSPAAPDDQPEGHGYECADGLLATSGTSPDGSACHVDSRELREDQRQCAVLRETMRVHEASMIGVVVGPEEVPQSEEECGAMCRVRPIKAWREKLTNENFLLYKDCDEANPSSGQCIFNTSVNAKTGSIGFHYMLFSSDLPPSCVAQAQLDGFGDEWVPFDRWKRFGLSPLQMEGRLRASMTLSPYKRWSRLIQWNESADGVLEEAVILFPFTEYAYHGGTSWSGEWGWGSGVSNGCRQGSTSWGNNQVCGQSYGVVNKEFVCKLNQEQWNALDKDFDAATWASAHWNYWAEDGQFATSRGDWEAGVCGKYDAGGAAEPACAASLAGAALQRCRNGRVVWAGSEALMAETKGGTRTSAFLFDAGAKCCVDKTRFVHEPCDVDDAVRDCSVAAEECSANSDEACYLACRPIAPAEVGRVQWPRPGVSHTCQHVGLCRPGTSSPDGTTASAPNRGFAWPRTPDKDGVLNRSASGCEECGEGTYSAEWGETQCTACSDCDPSWCENTAAQTGWAWNKETVYSCEAHEANRGKEDADAGTCHDLFEDQDGNPTQFAEDVLWNGWGSIVDFKVRDMCAYQQWENAGGWGNWNTQAERACAHPPCTSSLFAAERHAVAPPAPAVGASPAALAAAGLGILAAGVMCGFFAARRSGRGARHTAAAAAGGRDADSQGAEELGAAPYSGSNVRSPMLHSFSPSERPLDMDATQKHLDATVGSLSRASSTASRADERAAAEMCSRLGIGPTTSPGGTLRSETGVSSRENTTASRADDRAAGGGHRRVVRDTGARSPKTRRAGSPLSAQAAEKVRGRSGPPTEPTVVDV